CGRALDAAAVAAVAWTVAAVAGGILAFLVVSGRALDTDADFGVALGAWATGTAPGRQLLATALVGATLATLCLAVRSPAAVGLITAATVLAGLLLDLGVGVLIGLAAAVVLRPAPPGALGGRRAALGRLGLVAVLGVLAGIAVVYAVAGLGTASADGTGGASPAQLLTGEPLPPPLTAASLVGRWHPDASWLICCALAAGLYPAAVIRLRRRGERWPPGRTALWLTGVLVLLLVTSGGPNAYERYLFGAHLGQLLALGLLVPLLLVPAAPGRLLLRLARVRPDGPCERLVTLGRGRAAAVLSHPLLAAALLAASLWLLLFWPPLLRWTTTDRLGHEWLTLHALAAGCLLVRAVLATGRRVVRALAVAVLLAALAALGLVLHEGSVLLLADWYGAMGWGTDALAAQRAAAVLVCWLGGIPVALLALTVAIRGRVGWGAVRGEGPG
ncbi:MAG: cytochrome c oxidase assembly protein, partial [Microbacteriaceae bacterium]